MSAAIAAGVLTVGAGALAADASKDAGKAAERGAKAAAGVSERQFDIANNLTANQRNIGNQALNALGARYGFNPAPGFGAEFDPFDLEPGKTVKGVGKGKISGADLRELLKQGLSIDQILEIGTLKDDANLSKVNGFKIPATEIQRLRSGTFSPEYMAANRPKASGTGIPDRFNPAAIAAGPGQFIGGSATNPAIDPNAPTSNLDRLRELAMSDPDLKRLAAAPTLDQFEASPDYQFRRGEGLDLVQNSAAAAGGLYSGNALRAITDFASNLASGEYNDFVGRRNQDFTRRLGLLESDFGRQSQFDQLQRNFSDGDFNRLATLAGIGTTATQQLNGVGVNTAANIGNALTSAGNARASGIEGQANAFGQTLNNLGGIAGFFSNRDPSVGRGSGVNSLQSLNFRGINPDVRFA